MTLSLAFHGAAGTVTGSKHLLIAHGTAILLDAGMFQGRKDLRLRNWEGPRFDVQGLDHVIVTHSHIDHIGYLPRLARLGLRAPVHCTPPADALAELMLLDAAKIQEQDAAYANAHGFSKHTPALPLYTTEDARRALALRSPQPYEQWFSLTPRGTVRARFLNAGHILGSSFVELRVATGSREVTIVYSGDVGRYDMPLHPDPHPLPACDVLIIESTYGDRTHPRTPLLEQIREPIERCFAARGTVLIPSFAVGRAQLITLMLRQLMRAGRLPEVPIHIDSPMATDATKIYSRFLDTRNLDAAVVEEGRLALFPRNVQFHRSVAESMRLNDLPGPRIIVSSSGMLTGGRVLHHLKRLAPDAHNLLLLIGYQAEGTRGRALVDGAGAVKVHGRMVPVRARFAVIDGLSGHADRDQLVRWMATAPVPPRVTFVVHGESAAAAALAQTIERRFETSVRAPTLGETFDIGGLLGVASG